MKAVSHVRTLTDLKNGHFLGLLSYVLVVGDGTVTVLGYMRHF
jgi:hypothetical protein